MIKLIFSYLLGGLASGLITILSTFLMTRLLSADVYGQGMLFISLMNMLYFFCNLGMDQVLVRFFYEPKYQDNMALLFYRCLFISVLGFLMFAMVFMSFGGNLLQWFQFNNPVLIQMLLVATLLFTLLRFMQLISRLRENVKIYNLAHFFTQFLFLLMFILTFYRFTTNYWSIVISQISAMTIVLIGLIFLYKRPLMLPLTKHNTIWDRKELLEFLKYGMPSLFSLSLTWLFLNLDKFFILKWSNYHELGIYTAAFALTAPLQFVQSTFNTAWAPRMNYMLIHRPFKSKKTFFLTFEKLSFSLTFLFLILVISKDYLILFLGHNFHDAVNIFPWLLFAPYFRTLSEVVFAGIVKSKKTYWHVFFSGCAACTNILGCYFLIPIWGATGAAISVAISFGVFFIMRV